MSSWKQGTYKLKHPEKYLGDPNNVVYRSSWEEYVFRIMDENPDILRWCSEEIAIPYPKPDIQTGQYRVASYYPDLFIVRRDVHGNIDRLLIEIKPHKQTKPPRSRKPSTRFREEYDWLVNQKKWEAARAWCEQRNIQFQLLTEQDLFG